jgi:hypothetical protein
MEFFSHFMLIKNEHPNGMVIPTLGEEGRKRETLSQNKNKKQNEELGVAIHSCIPIFRRCRQEDLEFKAILGSKRKQTNKSNQQKPRPRYEGQGMGG